MNFLDGLGQYISTAIECSSYGSIVNMTRLGLGISSMTTDHITYSKNEKNIVRVLDDVVAEMDKISFMHRDDSSKLSVIQDLKAITQKNFKWGNDEKNYKTSPYFPDSGPFSEKEIMRVNEDFLFYVKDGKIYAVNTPRQQYYELSVDEAKRLFNSIENAEEFQNVFIEEEFVINTEHQGE